MSFPKRVQPAIAGVGYWCLCLEDWLLVWLFFAKFSFYFLVYCPIYSLSPRAPRSSLSIVFAARERMATVGVRTCAVTHVSFVT